MKPDTMHMYDPTTTLPHPAEHYKKILTTINVHLCKQTHGITQLNKVYEISYTWTAGEQ